MFSRIGKQKINKFQYVLGAHASRYRLSVERNSIILGASARSLSLTSAFFTVTM
jgi:hypothetical protein